MKLRIHSGGQTGADIAGLWVAKTMGLPTGGVAPDGYLTQLGKKPLLNTLFGLHDHGDYRQRTIQNVRESDVTLIFSRQMQSPGTILTRNSALRLKKPVFAIEDNRHDGETLRQYWANKDDPRHAVFNNALNFLLAEAKRRSALELDDFFIINVAGNATKRSIPEAFDFAFVGMWFMLMLYGHGMNLMGRENFAKDFIDVDPVDLASALRDRYEMV